MHISYLKIRNYRGIKSDEFEASPFTCAIGENNAGKSTILLATSLFFSGTSLSRCDYYNTEEEIEIEVTFSDIKDGDINRLAAEHRDKIKELIEDGRLTLIRLYSIEGASDLRIRKLAPKDSKFSKEVVSAMLKGKSGKEIATAIISLLPQYSKEFSGVTTQKNVSSIIESIVATLPPDQLEYKLSPLPTGIENSIKNFLPEPIYIAAVKDLKDDVKTKESTTFGKLLSILLKFLEGSTHFGKISESFNELHSLLNIIRDAEKTSDQRIDRLQAIECQITDFLKENFPQSKVEIEIPKPELRQVFSNAKILIDDGVKDIIDTKGDGIKRAVTFALLRTYVLQLKQQKKELAQEKNKVKESESVESAKPETVPEYPSDEVLEQPYIFLFEEPELFLHPNAQKILFEALENLTKEDNQVLVTTHSPLFFSPNATGTFIKVIKQYPEDSKPFGKFLSINLLKELQKKDAFQIICYENNTAAFFARKVLFVEGDSDVIYLKEVARLLNEEWNFDNRNIPIISIDGKSNVKRFKEFYNFFEIQTYVIVDADALIDGFEKFEVNDEIKLQREKLLRLIDKKAEEKGIEGDISVGKIKELAGRYSWKNRYLKLKEIACKMMKREQVKDEELLEIEYLFAEEENNKRRQIFTDNTIELEGKQKLLEQLRGLNIFILSKGAIESYYPSGITGEDKPTKAMNAIKYLKEQEDCRKHLPTIKFEGKEVNELDLIFIKIFS